MKFLHYLALIATTTAIRLQQVNPTDSLIEIEKKIEDPEVVWQRYDVNNDGHWDLKECKRAFKGIMEYYGHKMEKGWQKEVKKAFKKIDKNGDKKISPKEFGVYIFQMVDANDDGKWSLKEVYQAFKWLADFSGNKFKKGWKDMVKKEFDQIDTSGDGKVSKKELFKAFEMHGMPDINDLFVDEKKTLMLQDLISLEKHIPDPEEVWKEMDTNKDGQWNLEETKAAFKKAMDYFGHKLPEGWEKAVEDEFKKADTSGDGQVSVKEMMTYLFKMVDSNSDGEWSFREVKRAIKWIAKFSGNELIKGWKAKVRGIFDQVDSDKSGKVSPKELFAALEEHGMPDINDLFKKKESRLQLQDLISLTKPVPNPKDVWRHFDANDDGMWSLEETKNAFKGAMEYFEYPLPEGWEKAVEEGFKKVDTSGDGQVSKKEMAVYLFEMVDSNSDGAWDLSEVKSAIKAVADFSGNELVDDWEDKVKEVFDNVDKDSDGKLSPKELMRALKDHGIPDINKLFK